MKDSEVNFYAVPLRAATLKATDCFFSRVH